MKSIKILEMRKSFVVLLAILLSISIHAQNEYTIYLVRHAEKQISKDHPRDPNLTSCGEERAEHLASYLEKINIDAVYSSDYTRTQNTAKPTADSKGLEIESYNPRELEDFAKLLTSRAQDALVVGHSNSTGILAGILTGEKGDHLTMTEDIYNRIYQVTVNGSTKKLNLFQSSFSCDAIPSVSRSPFIIGETLEFQSGVLNEERKLNIYLPASYSENPDKLYQVIYLLDGSADEDFIHTAGLVQFANFPWLNIIPESIVVGIANVDRKRDFTFPTTVAKDKEQFPTTGSSKAFLEYVEQEVQPLIEANYRTESSKTIVGQSLGGLLATEILFKKPELFDKYIIVSPSLWWDDESLLQYKPKTYSTEKSVYIAVGKEGPVMEKVALELYNKLDMIKSNNTELYYQFLEKQDHGDTLHPALYDAFEKLYKKEE